MDRERIDGWCEKGILGLVLAILIFGPLALGGLGAWQFLVLQGLTIAVMAVWIVRLWISSSPKLLWPPICWAVLAFMLYAIGRYLTSDIEYVARGELIRILVYGFLFFAIVNNLHRQDSTQIIGITMIGLGMLLSFYAAYQFVSKSPKVWGLPSFYVGRGSGTFYYPNHFASFLEMLLPLALAYAVIGRLSHVTKIFLVYAAAVMLAGIAVSLSRGGWLATAIILILMCVIFLAQRDYRIHGLVLFGLLIAALTFTIPRVRAFQERLAKLDPTHKVDNLRFALWQPALDMWHDHFWWGVGPANFDYKFSKYRPSQVQLRAGWVHNDYLNTLVDYGLAGTLLVAAAWILLYWGAVTNWKSVRGGRDDFSRKKSNKLAFLVGASLGLLGIAIHSVVDFNFHMPANAIMAVTWMALLSVQWRFTTERFWFRAGKISQGIATVVLLAGIIYLGREGWRAGWQYVWLQRADRAGQPPHVNSNAQIEALEHAATVDPMNFETTYAIGECYRGRSWDGGDDYAAQAQKAIDWFRRGIKLDPYNSFNWLRIGMCLDWINSSKGEDPNPYFHQANELDPNGYYTTAYIGWHYMQIGDLAAARTWFERSQRLEWLPEDNPLAFQYLPIVERRLKEFAEDQKPPEPAPKP
jgi:O-antigen ligase